MNIISIVVPAYNEEKLIERTLQSIRKQKANGYKLIVVDNGSTDRTREIAEKYADEVIYEPKRGCSFARQRGFSACSSEFVATTDADTVVPEDWTQRILAIFTETPQVVGVYGPVNLHGATALQDRAAAQFATFLRFTHAIGFPHFIGCNFAVRRSTFEKIGGFRTDIHIYSDLDLSFRLRKEGQIVLDVGLVVVASARRIRHMGLFRFTLDYIVRVILKRSGKKRLDIR